MHGDTKLALLLCDSTWTFYNFLQFYNYFTKRPGRVNATCMQLQNVVFHGVKLEKCTKCKIAP